MIYGEIKDLGLYKGISKNLDRAIDYICLLYTSPSPRDA